MTVASVVLEVYELKRRPVTFTSQQSLKVTTHVCFLGKFSTISPGIGGRTRQFG